MKKREFAKLIGITARRCAQLLEDGLLSVLGDGKGIDPIPSLVSLLAAERAKNSQRDAKSRLTEAQIRGNEIRARRTIRQLVTVDELDSILRVFLDEGLKAATNLGGELYYQLLPRLGQMEARVEAYKVSGAVQRLYRSHQSATAGLCDHLRRAMLPDNARIDAVLRGLIADPQPVPGEPKKAVKRTVCKAVS